MNREQRRALAERAHKHGMSKELAKTYAEIAGGTGEHTKAQEIIEGDKVSLNISALKKRKNYERMSPKYKEFIESAEENMMFTAHVEGKNLISLKEFPQWLFWSGDLIKAEADKVE